MCKVISLLLFVLKIFVVHLAVKGHSIFVGNLPETATVGQLKVIFEQFGPIKPDGIRVRSQKVCFKLFF